jgi:hypothetical protein
MVRAAAMPSHRGVNRKAMALEAYPFGSGTGPALTLR